MKKIIFIGLWFCLVNQNAVAMFKDDPWLNKVMSELEYLQEEGEGVLEWDIDAWRGRDLSKYWIKTSGEAKGSEIEHANIELVFSHAITANWDQQFGIRHEYTHDDSPKRNWLSFGFIGTAPYFFDVDARLFLGEESSSQILIEVEREFMLSQEWVLTPEIDILANGKTNRVFEEGSGLAATEFGLRLGYEHRGNRKFQPFIGVSSKHTFGTTRSIR